MEGKLARTQEQIIGGAMIHHCIAIQKGEDSVDHLKRLKARIIELDFLILGSTAEDKKKHMTVREAVEIVYEKLPFGEFSGTVLSEKVRFLTGRSHMHNDSALRKLRSMRSEGIINCPNIGSPKLSIYEKLHVYNCNIVTIDVADSTAHRIA